MRHADSDQDAGRASPCAATRPPARRPSSSPPAPIPRPTAGPPRAIRSRHDACRCAELAAGPAAPQTGPRRASGQDRTTAPTGSGRCRPRVATRRRSHHRARDEAGKPPTAAARSGSVGQARGRYACSRSGRSTRLRGRCEIGRAKAAPPTATASFIVRPEHPGSCPNARVRTSHPPAGRRWSAIEDNPLMVPSTHEHCENSGKDVLRQATSPRNAAAARHSNRALRAQAGVRSGAPAACRALTMAAGFAARTGSNVVFEI